MADVGEMTTEEHQQLEEKIRKVWTRSTNCPISGHNNWNIARHFVQPITLGPENTQMLGGGVAGYPVAQVTCMDCGYTMFFNAVVLGMKSGREVPDGDDS